MTTYSPNLQKLKTNQRNLVPQSTFDIRQRQHSTIFRTISIPLPLLPSSELSRITCKLQHTRFDNRAIATRCQGRDDKRYESSARFGRFVIAVVIGPASSSASSSAQSPASSRWRWPARSRVAVCSGAGVGKQWSAGLSGF